MEIRSLGRYEVRADLGRGTMGVVYRGYDPVLDREIALKTVGLPAGLEPERRTRFLERFFLEAKIAAKLIHPNIVVTHDAATDETTSTPFIAMELVSGESLQARLERGPVAWREALAMVAPLARALDYAHQAGVVHRDIKPANVLLNAAGEPKIADFGIAKLPDTHLTQSGKVMGTPYFMSPEQLEGDDVDGRSDLFSLGALLYNLLTGVPPFRGKDLASITQQVLYKTPPEPSEVREDVPSDVDGVVARAMAKDREERYQSGSELAEELLRLLSGEEPLRPLCLGEKTLETLVVEPTSRSTPRRRSNRVLVLALVAIVAGAVYRWDDIDAALEPLRERHQENVRREGVKASAASALEDARAFLADGDFERARVGIETALARSRDARDGEGEGLALYWRGRLEAELGAWSKGRADLDASASVLQIYGLPERRAMALAELGNLERDLGNYDRAAALYDDAGRFVDTTSCRAMLALMRGELGEAEEGFRRSGQLLYAGAAALARGDAEAAEAAWSAHPDEDEAQRWRARAAEAVGDSDEGVLYELFRPEVSTPRDEIRLERLLTHP